MTVVAITGGSGFIGAQLCAAARAARIEHRPIPRAALGVDDLSGLLRGVDVVVHLAARAHDRRHQAAHEADDSLIADNVDLTRRVGDACTIAGVRRLLFVSSAGVLGASSPPGGFGDTSPAAPHDAYTRSKLAAERLLRERYADRLETVIIRPPLVYGPGAKGSFSRLMKLATTSWPLPLGAMTAPRSLISVRNLCDLLLWLAREPGAGGLCVLAADRETTSVAELVRSIRDARGRPARLVACPPPLLRTALRLVGRRQDVAGLTAPFVIRGSEVLAAMGWAPPRRLHDEIRWTVGCERSGSGAS